MYKNTGRFAALGATAVLATMGLAGGASAAPTVVVQPSPNTVGPVQIQTGGVWGVDVHDNTLPWSKFGSDFRTNINKTIAKADAAKAAADQALTKANDVRQQVYADAITAPVVITNVGGPIATNGTKLSAVDLVLPAGTYLVQVSGQVDRTTAAATPGKATQPQLSLWFDTNNDDVFQWQTGEGSISPNGTIPDTKDRSVTVNGQTMKTLTQPTHVKLIAFGYNADTSAAGGGELTVGAALVTATPVK
jgi:hypothetical protein